MNEFSECCSAARHHIFDELCSECLDHAEFVDYDEDEE